MSCSRVLLCVLLPPLAVLDRGCGSVLIVTLLTLCGWVPGALAALLITGQTAPPITVVHPAAAYPPGYGPGPGSPMATYYPAPPLVAPRPLHTGSPRILAGGGVVVILFIVGTWVTQLAARGTPHPAAPVAAVLIATPHPATAVPIPTPFSPPVVLTENAKRGAVATEIAPAAPAVLGFQDTATLPGWVLSLGQLAVRPTVQASGTTYQPSGRYWLVWLDARNTTDQPRALAPDLRFALVDADGQEVPDLGVSSPDTAKLIARTLDRAGLTTLAQPGAVAHSLLIFDLPATAIPQQLILHQGLARQAFTLADPLQEQGIVAEVPTPPAPPPTVPHTAAVTAAEQVYIAALAAQSTEFGPLFEQLTTDTAAPDPRSSAWIIRMAVTMAGIQYVCEKASRLTAPVSLAAVDTPYQSGMRRFNRAMDLMASGIDQRDGDLITQASAEMTLGSEDIYQATQALNAFTAAHK